MQGRHRDVQEICVIAILTAPAMGGVEELLDLVLIAGRSGIRHAGDTNLASRPREFAEKSRLPGELRSEEEEEGDDVDAIAATPLIPELREPEVVVDLRNKIRAEPR